MRSHYGPAVSEELVGITAQGWARPLKEMFSQNSIRQVLMALVLEGAISKIVRMKVVPAPNPRFPRVGQSRDFTPRSSKYPALLFSARFIF